jgi:hypothetical protein
LRSALVSGVKNRVKNRFLESSEKYAMKRSTKD